MITKFSSEYEVRKLCRVLGVSTSGYYGWLNHKPSRREIEDNRLILEIRKVHERSRQNYGIIKTWKTLQAQGILCGKHRVARLRRQHRILSRRRRRFKVTTQSKYKQWAAPNQLNRQFRSERPNQAWVGDVTFVGTRRGTLYLAVLLDLFSRKVVGWSMSNRNNTELVMKALEMALLRRKPKAEVIHHTDQGVVYTAYAYQHQLQKHGLVSSMSRRGDCYDNAVAESFFSTLKNEWLWENMKDSPEQARREIFEYIESFYNRQRLHQTLNYLTPEQAEMTAVA